MHWHAVNPISALSMSHCQVSMMSCVSGGGSGPLLLLYKGAWINACESRILATLAKLAGRSLPVVSRTNLVDLLLKHIVKPLDRVNVIGDDFEVVRRLQAKYGPGQDQPITPQ